VTVHEAANVTGGSSEVFGRAGMTHDVKGVSDEGKGESESGLSTRMACSAAESEGEGGAGCTIFRGEVVFFHGLRAVGLVSVAGFPPGVRRQAEMRLPAGSLRGEISMWLNLNWSGLASFRL